MNSSKRIIIYSLLSVITILVAITGLTYAYFTANIVSNTGNNNITVHTTIGNCENPVFTSYISKNLELEVTTAGMLQNGNSVAASDNASIYVKFIGSKAGTGGTCNGTITCTYDLIWHNMGETFVKSAAVPTGQTEYGLAITGAGSATKNIATLNDGDIILANESISSNGSLVTKTYSVTSTMYNLNYVQDFMNKHYQHSITVENIVCS